MHSAQFIRILKNEVEKLYHQSSTPASFMSRMLPLIETLEIEDGSDILSERDLEGILISLKSPEDKNTRFRNCFFDIVDLSMYREN